MGNLKGSHLCIVEAHERNYLKNQTGNQILKTETRIL